MQASAITTEGTPVQQAYAAFVRADKQHSQYLEQVEASKDRFSHDGLAQQLSAFAQTGVAKAVDQHHTAVAEYVGRIEAEVQAIKQGLRPGDDMAAQLQADRRWQRTKGVLDAADSGAVAAAAQRALASASPAEVAVLAEELQTYLESRRVPSDWVDDALGQVVPKLGEARERLPQARKAHAVLTHDANKLRRNFTSGTRSSVPLVNPTHYDPDRR